MSMSTRTAGEAKGDVKHEAHNDENPAPEAGMSVDVINIGLNVFRVGTRRYEQKVQDSLEWLWGYAHDILQGSKSALEKETGITFDRLYKAFTGREDGDMTSLCEMIEQLRIRVGKQMPLVNTIVTKRITEALDYARDYAAMVMIKGPTGRGKTYTAQHWARLNNHGQTRYVRASSGCTRKAFVMMLCQSCGIGINGKKCSELEMRLFRAFTPRNTIIVDEAGHMMPGIGGSSTSAIEFIRDLHDICGCAVVMIFTDVYLDEMRHGRLANYFEQFIGRIKFELAIPKEVLRDEVLAVVKSFNRRPDAALVNLALNLSRQRDGKLRTLFEDLKRANSFAAEKERELTAADLQLAADWRKSGGLWPGTVSRPPAERQPPGRHRDSIRRIGRPAAWRVGRRMPSRSTRPTRRSMQPVGQTATGQDSTAT